MVVSFEDRRSQPSYGIYSSPPPYHLQSSQSRPENYEYIYDILTTYNKNNSDSPPTIATDYSHTTAYFTTYYTCILPGHDADYYILTSSLTGALGWYWSWDLFNHHTTTNLRPVPHTAS